MQISTCLPSILGILCPIIIPIASVVAMLIWWSEYTRFVDHDTCTCSCWDTVFKGPYESGPITKYKHFYFNATSNTAKIWILVVIGIVTNYECVKYLIGLTISKSIRYSMLFLFAIIFFSHYYALWMYIGYYNDDFYSQWNHQTFFALTELVSTVMVFHLLNSRNEVTSRKTLCIVGIALLHIIAGGFDQFISNVLKGKGERHQIVRDIFLMVPDIFHVTIPIWLYCKTGQYNHYTKLCYDRKLKYEIVVTLAIAWILLMIWYKAM